MSDDHPGRPPVPDDGWKHTGVRVIPGDGLDPNTAQTPGMDRAAAVDAARVGARKIWAGTVHIHPDAKTGAHHHGALESVLFVIRGRAGCAGANTWSSPPRQGPGTSSSSRRTSPTRRSTPRPTRPWSASWSQRQRGHRGQPGHRTGRETGVGALGRRNSSSRPGHPAPHFSLTDATLGGEVHVGLLEVVRPA